MKRTRLAWLWPVPVGVILGACFLAPFVAKPPVSHDVGAGMGGLLGLAAALYMRFAIERPPVDKSTRQQPTTRIL